MSRYALRERINYFKYKSLTLIVFRNFLKTDFDGFLGLDLLKDNRDNVSKSLTRGIPGRYVLIRLFDISSVCLSSIAYENMSPDNQWKIVNTFWLDGQIIRQCKVPINNDYVPISILIAADVFALDVILVCNNSQQWRNNEMTKESITLFSALKIIDKEGPIFSSSPGPLQSKFRPCCSHSSITITLKVFVKFTFLIPSKIRFVPRLISFGFSLYLSYCQSLDISR